MAGEKWSDLISRVSQAVQALNNLSTVIGQAFPNFVPAPATAASPGTAGQVAFDAGHIYVCIATNTWVRAALVTF
jgi:hypothetical protein